MRSKADGLLKSVLSPNKTEASPWKVTTGLTPLEYRSSRSALLGFHASLITFLRIPRFSPPGENQGSLSQSVLAHRPATSPFNGIQRYTSLNLSY